MFQTWSVWACLGLSSKSCTFCPASLPGPAATFLAQRRKVGAQEAARRPSSASASVRVREGCGVVATMATNYAPLLPLSVGSRSVTGYMTGHLEKRTRSGKEVCVLSAKHTRDRVRCSLTVSSTCDREGIIRWHRPPESLPASSPETEDKKPFQERSVHSDGHITWKWKTPCW